MPEVLWLAYNNVVWIIYFHNSQHTSFSTVALTTFANKWSFFTEENKAEIVKEPTLALRTDG